MNLTRSTPAAAGWTIPVVVVFLSMPTDAWAYVDPGTGSYFFQLATAALLAGMYMLRHWSAIVIGWCGRVAGRRPPAGGTGARERESRDVAG